MKEKGAANGGDRRSSLLRAAVHSVRSHDRAERSSEPIRATASSLSDFFRLAAQHCAEAFGSSWAFVVAVVVVVAWAATGPIFGYSDTWQLVINTGTTVVTFLMVFLIQNAQNRDAKAFHLKLDELIYALRGARNELIDLENLTDEELEKIEREFQRLAKQRRTSRADHVHSHQPKSDPE